MSPRDSKTWYQDIDAILGKINCGLVARDRDRKLVYVNDRLLRWIGYERHELLGEETEILIPTDLRFLISSELAEIEGGDVRARITVFRRKDGTGFPVLLLPQAFNDDDGEVLGGITVVVDLAAIQTAKQAGYAAEGTLRGSLERVVLEIQSLGIAADVPASARAPLEHPELAGLSPREREILTHLLSAHRVPQIAEALHISQNTVRNHLKSIFQKIGVSSQAALIRKVRSLSS